MGRFLTAWVTSAIIYVFGGAVVSVALTLAVFVGFNLQTRASVQNLWLYGPFCFPGLSQRVFLDPGPAPELPDKASPEREAQYQTEYQQYSQRYDIARHRADVVAAWWIFIAITILTLLYVLVRPSPDKLRNA